eukprot:CAMPEP_0172172072 /NCGR_PEP_ID=MMETSP1050-20130122/12243_1 /TAXON_ID=233186 /ORGANISM="Cryptomonas curvata, Strain CCAP979/52" /LENGTH=33 /DNA_ID= /DNA_START= /DNA_END= /DNA_ORIENTATION=
MTTESIYFNGKELMPCLPCGGKHVMAVILRQDN